MKQRTCLGACALGLLLMLASPASAAERFSLSFEGGYQGLSSASKSAKAVFDGSTGGITFGGSVRLAVSRMLFVGAGLRTFSKEGERVYVADASGPVFKLGHPLKIKLRPFYGFAGLRFRADSALVPYVAAGAGVTSYSEDSTIGGLDESSSESKFSWHAMAGADYALGSAFALGFEARWSSTPNIIGLGGVSKVYGETDLGGFTVVGRLSFRR